MRTRPPPWVTRWVFYAAAVSGTLQLIHDGQIVKTVPLITGVEPSARATTVSAEFTSTG